MSLRVATVMGSVSGPEPYASIIPTAVFLKSGLPSFRSVVTSTKASGRSSPSRVSVRTGDPFDTTGVP